MPSVLLLHGGAGSRATPGRRKVLQEALRAGWKHLVLNAAPQSGVGQRFGHSALEAVVESVAVLEDSGLFNAGRGSYLDLDGVPRADASVMVSEGGGGGVASLPRVLHPIRVARAVMEETPHLLLAGEPAWEFARRMGLARGYRVPARRRRQLAGVRRGLRGRPWEEQLHALRHMYYHGTVGAVALDGAGGLAAATSTGGRRVKLAGRVGDSAILGAGTYVNRVAAASATGHGEAILWTGLSREAVRRVERGASPRVAARGALGMMKRETGSDGGLIVVDRRGRAGAAWTSRGMATARRVSR